LVRSVSREGELAVRTALGAGRGRLVRQLATESVVLSVIGGVVGLAIASVGTKLLVRMAPATLPRLDSIQIDSAVLAFTSVLSLVTGLAFGLLPSRTSTRPDIASTLREGGRGSGMRRSSHRARRLLVVVELALSVMLLAGAGLLIKSFERLTSVDPGFRTDHAVSFAISLPAVKYKSDEQLSTFVTSMLDRVRALGGVQKAGAAMGMPLTPFGMTFTFSVSGRVYKSPADQPSAEVRVATPDYLATMTIPTLKGRGFNATDRRGAARAFLITESAVKQFFPNENPIGKHITLGWNRDAGDLDGDVVGVVGDIKQTSLADKPLPQFYVAYDQWPVRSFNVVIRSARNLSSVARDAATAIHEIDPDLAVSSVKSLDDVFAESVAQPRFYMMLLTVFAVLALVLSSVGIYGVIAYLVGQRTREIGIRVALGASRGNVMRLVAREGLSMTAIGVTAGLVGAIALSRLMQALLFETAPTDVWTFVEVVALLSLVAIVASLVPALRAARIDPVLAIRAE
ncbi:MAG: FtsX-like permease family protein, partial [Gemmatimonas sp.]